VSVDASVSGVMRDVEGSLNGYAHTGDDVLVH
jgi:hypothetical protein